MNAGRLNRGKPGALIRRGARALGVATVLIGAFVPAGARTVFVPMAQGISTPHSLRLLSYTVLQAEFAGLGTAVHQAIERSPADRAWRARAIGRDPSPASSTGNQNGFSVAIADNTAVSGAPGFSHGAGAANIYQRSGGTAKWVQVATLTDPRGASNDRYASSVAIARTKADTYLVIGGNDTNGQPDNVYVYTGSDKVWQQQTTIPDPGDTSQDKFGKAVAISGTTLIAGAPGVNSKSGAAYIYQRSGSGSLWLQRANLPDPAGNPGDQYGESVAISGNTALIGANDAAYAYTNETGKGWVQTATISNPGSSSGNFGASVALSGTTVVIGAPGSPPGPPNYTPGAVYIYKLSGTGLTLQQTLIPPSGGGSAYSYGLSVALIGSAIVVGMPLYGAASLNCGAAFTYTMSGGKWTEKGMQVDPDCTGQDMFGFSVGVSGAYAAYGAPDTKNDNGAAYELKLP